MTIAELAVHLDRHGRLREAAWAYETAVQKSMLPLDGILDLTAVYYSLSDPGRYMLEPFGREIASVAMWRSREVLAMGAVNSPPDPEIDAWAAMIRAHRYGENVPFEVFERLASNGSLIAEIFVAEDRARLSARAIEVLAVPEELRTERYRVMHHYAP